MEALKYFCLAVLVVSVAVHLATFVPGAQLTMGWGFLVVLGVLVAFGYSVTRLRTLLDRSSPERLSRTWSRRSASTVSLTPYTAKIPRRWKIFCVAVTAYAVVNFILCMTSVPTGTVEHVGGQYRLVDHGHLIRTVSTTEADHINTAMLRAFTGHSVAFSTWAYIAIVFLIPAVEGGASEGAAGRS